MNNHASEDMTVSFRSVFAALMICAPVCLGDGIDLQAEASAPGRPLVHYWSECVGAGRANEGLRATWLESLKTAHDECGFQYVRFHGLFHDDMFVFHRENGQDIYNFQYVDDLFDRLLAIGVRPFVELSFNPIDPPGPFRQFWWRANATPPSDNATWAELVQRLVRHCIRRYGIDEVRKWYFEVWNEPNLQAFFHGGNQKIYFDLYRATALAIKQIDPQLRVGGPATSNFHPPPGSVARSAAPEDIEALNWQPVWVADFLKFCHDDSVPLDFISTHPYPQDFAFDDGTGHRIRARRGIGATHHDLQVLRDMVDHSDFPHAQIQLTEWSSSPSSRDFSHDCLPAAAFIAKTNIESAGLIDGLSYWTFTDVFEEKGAGNTIFHGGFGLINYQQIVKPAFHAYQMMNELGDQTLSTSPGGIVTRDSRSGRLIALAYDYPSEVRISLPTANTLADAEKMQHTGSPEPLNVAFTGLPPNAKLLVETLDATHGDAITAWEAMGRPPEPTRAQTQVLRAAAMATKKEMLSADSSGRFQLQREIDPWSLVVISQQ